MTTLAKISPTQRRAASLAAPVSSSPYRLLNIDLDTATRVTVVTAACLALYNAKRTVEIGDWRKATADWDFVELLHQASILGVHFFSGGKPFVLPREVTPIRSQRP
jgi:hypothetical protein